MKSFIEHLLNESIVDQYKRVRAAAIPGDELMRSVEGTAWPSRTSLFSKIDSEYWKNYINSNGGLGMQRFPVIWNHAKIGKPENPIDSWAIGNYESEPQRAITDISNGQYLGDKIQTNSHELAHAYQHERQMRKIDANGNTTRSGFWANNMLERMPRLANRGPTIKPTRSDRRKTKRNEKISVGGLMSGSNNTRAQYYNSDIEINARVIGHAAANLDRRLDPDKPDTTAHMEELADHLFRSQRSDIPNTRRHVQTAIENVRAENLARFKKQEEQWQGIEPKSVKKAMHQYGRLIQYHEEQLPEDIYTPEGRDSFIRTHGTTAMFYNI